MTLRRDNPSEGQPAPTHYTSCQAFRTGEGLKFESSLWGAVNSVGGLNAVELGTPGQHPFCSGLLSMAVMNTMAKSNLEESFILQLTAHHGENQEG